MLSPITVFALEADTLKTVKVHPQGPMIRAETVAKQPLDLPRDLHDLFAAALKRGPVQVAVCRIPGVRENAQGTHQRVYLAPANDRIQTVGVTI